MRQNPTVAAAIGTAAVAQSVERLPVGVATVANRRGAGLVSAAFGQHPDRHVPLRVAIDDETHFTSLGIMKHVLAHSVEHLIVREAFPVTPMLHQIAKAHRAIGVNLEPSRSP